MTGTFFLISIDSYETREMRIVDEDYLDSAEFLAFDGKVIREVFEDEVHNNNKGG